MNFLYYLFFSQDKILRFTSLNQTHINYMSHSLRHVDS